MVLTWFSYFNKVWLSIFSFALLCTFTDENIFITLAVTNVNLSWYHQIILASVPLELKSCTALVIHQAESGVDEATTVVLEVLETQDKFLLSANSPNGSAGLRESVDVHRFRDRCTISFVQVSYSHKLDPERTTIKADLLYELINSMDGVIKKDEDYFIFHSLQGQSIDVLFKRSLVASRVKNKLGVRLDSSDRTNEHNPDVTLYTTCIYCADGKPSPHIISILNHSSASIHLSSSVPSHILFPDLLKNFHGKEFAVSTPVLARWLIEIRETSPGHWEVPRGVMNSAFRHVMQKYNFSSKFFPSFGGGGTGYRFPNGTWLGTIRDILSGRAEIGQTTGQIYNRNKVAGFSFPISYEWLTFSCGKPQPSYSWKAVYWPFTPFLWLAVIGSVLFAFFTFAFLLKGTMGQTCSTEKMAANYLLRSFLEQDAKIVESHPRNSTRTFIAFWLIFSMLITVAYRSKLVSFLAFPDLEQPPETFEALSKSSHYQIALQYLRGAAYSLIKTSTNPTFKTIFSKMDLIENDAKCFQRAIEQPHFACISWDAIASFVYHKNISDKYGNAPLIKARDTTSFIVVGLTFLKRAVFRIKFDTVLFRACDMGLMRKWTELDYVYIRNERAKWEKETNRPPVTYPLEAPVDALKIQNLSGTCYILFAGLLASIVLFLWEALVWQWKHKDGILELHQGKLNQDVNRFTLRKRMVIK